MNFFADRDFNLEAGRNVNIKATGLVSGSDNITGRVRIESAVQRKDPILEDQEDNDQEELVSESSEEFNLDDLSEEEQLTSKIGKARKGKKNCLESRVIVLNGLKVC